MRQDIAASLIGGLLIGGLTPTATDVLATLDAETFEIPIYKRAYEVIRKQARTRNMIDSLMVAEECGDEHFADIMKMAHSCPNAANLRSYADVVTEMYQRRMFVSAVDEMRGTIGNSSIEVGYRGDRRTYRSTVRHSKAEAGSEAGSPWRHHLRIHQHVRAQPEKRGRVRHAENKD
ncbi:MAG: DnaB-like helicase N-terminal domain-containing protein [Symbiopectobacterium sp.]